MNTTDNDYLLAIITIYIKANSLTMIKFKFYVILVDVLSFQKFISLIVELGICDACLDSSSRLR